MRPRGKHVRFRNTPPHFLKCLGSLAMHGHFYKKQIQQIALTTQHIKINCATYLIQRNRWKKNLRDHLLHL